MPDTAAPPSLTDGPMRGGPDPTSRTVEALYREVDHLKEIMNNHNAAYNEAIRLLQARQDRQPQPAEVNAKVESLDRLVAKEFEAGRMAIEKQEVATAKQLETLARLIEALTKAGDDRIADIKDRLTVIESVDRGKGDQRNENRGAQAALIGLAGFFITVLAVGMTALAFFIGGN